MTELSFSLKGEEFIDLTNLLKLLSLVNSGGEAKVRIAHEEVKLNGELETRRRKKLRNGDVIEFDGKIIKVNE
jgi:ribosome-associated protein